MISVTCRNGEHFTIDPDAIERVETVPDTVLHMVDGSKYVIDQHLDALLAVVRIHRAAGLLARNRLGDDGAPPGRRPRTDHRPINVLPDDGEG